MENTKWQQFCEEIKSVPYRDEKEFEGHFIKDLRSVFGWKNNNEAKEIKKQVEVPSGRDTKRADATIEHDGKVAVVIELKAPSVNLDHHEAQQLASYISHLRAEFGILSNPSNLQLYYFPLQYGAEAQKVLDIPYDGDNEDGKRLGELLNRNDFSEERLKEFCEEKLQAKKDAERVKELTAKLSSEDGKSIIECALLDSDLKNEYSIDMIKDAVSNLYINLRTNLIIPPTPSPTTKTENHHTQPGHRAYNGQRILFCRIGWAERYVGDPNDKPIGGGGYNNEGNTGMETFNFAGETGHCYGFVETMGTKHGTPHKMRIEKIDQAAEKADSVDNVLVIWIATKPKLGGQFIVGWYKNATVFRGRPQAPQGTERYGGSVNKTIEVADYNVLAKTSDVHLLPPDERNFGIPKAGNGNVGIGNSNFWYANKNEDEKQFTSKVVDYISRYGR